MAFFNHQLSHICNAVLFIFLRSLILSLIILVAETAPSLSVVLPIIRMRHQCPCVIIYALSVFLYIENYTDRLIICRFPIQTIESWSWMDMLSMRLSQCATVYKRTNLLTRHGLMTSMDRRVDLKAHRLEPLFPMHTKKTEF